MEKFNAQGGNMFGKCKTGKAITFWCIVIFLLIFGPVAYIHFEACRSGVGYTDGWGIERCKGG